LRPEVCSGSGSGRLPAAGATRPRSRRRSGTRPLAPGSDTSLCGPDLTGDAPGIEHGALGSDFGGAVPVPFDASGLVLLTEALIDTGFADDEIAKVMGGNARRLLRDVLP